MSSQRKGKRKSRKNRSGLYLIIGVVGIFVGVLGFKMVSLNAECNQLKAEQVQLQEKKEKLQKESEEIKDKAAYVKSDKYIEDVARKKLGLVYKDEVIFKAENKD